MNARPFLTVKNHPPSFFKRKVRENWLIWKPVKEGLLTYSEAIMCDEDTLREAGMLADMMAKANSGKKGKKGG